MNNNSRSGRQYRSQGQNRRQNRQRNFSSRSGGSAGIILVTLLSIFGAAIGLSAGSGVTLFLSLVVAAVMYAIKRFFLANTQSYERTTENVLFKGSGYLFMASITFLFTAYGAYTLATYIQDSISTPHDGRVEAGSIPKSQESATPSSLVDRDWQGIIEEIKAYITSRKRMVDILEENDPMKTRLGEHILDAGRALLRVEILLGNLTDRTSAIARSQIIPSERLNGDRRSTYSVPEWGWAVKALRSYIDKLEAQSELMGTQFKEQLSVLRSWMAELEIHLSHFPNQIQEYRGTTIHNSGSSYQTQLFAFGEIRSVQDGTKDQSTAAINLAPSFRQNTYIPAGLSKFWKDANDGEVTAIISLIAALILEVLIYFKVKQKQQDEWREW